MIWYTRIIMQYTIIRRKCQIIGTILFFILWIFADLGVFIKLAFRQNLCKGELAL